MAAAEKEATDPMIPIGEAEILKELFVLSVAGAWRGNIWSSVREITKANDKDVYF